MVRPSVYPSIHLSIHPSIHPSMYYVDTLPCRTYGFIEYSSLKSVKQAIADLKQFYLGRLRLHIIKVSSTDVVELLIEQYVCPQYISDE